MNFEKQFAPSLSAMAKIKRALAAEVGRALLGRLLVAACNLLPPSLSRRPPRNSSEGPPPAPPRVDGAGPLLAGPDRGRRQAAQSPGLGRGLSEQGCRKGMRKGRYEEGDFERKSSSPAGVPRL